MTPIWLPKSQSTIYPRFSSDNPGWLTITCRYKCSKATMLLSLNVMKADRCGCETTCQKSKPSVYELTSKSTRAYFTQSLILPHLQSTPEKRPKSICQLAWSPETQRGTIGQWWKRSWVVEDKVSTEIVASPSTFEWGPWKKTWERDAFLPLLEGRNGLMAQGHMEGEVKAKKTPRRPETEDTTLKRS